MHQNRILTIASIAVAAAIVVTAGFILLGIDRSETQPEIIAPAAPAQPPVVATVTTQVVTPTPAPVDATPRPPAVVVVTPVPTPVAEVAAEERPGLAPWVYYFPTKWVPDAAEWPESFRWQDPLPTIEPPLNWEHDTWRTPYPTFEGYYDRPFILDYGDTFDTLTPQVESDMHAIFATHHLIMAEWAVMQETLELDGIDPYVALNLEQWLRDEALPDLRTQGVGVQVSPYVHEIIAMTIFGNRAEVLQVYRGSSGTYYDVETGELRYGTTPDDSAFRGDVSYTYAQWHRIDGRWTEVGATFSADSALTPAEWLTVLSPPLVPYVELWEAALAQESVARGGAR